jgi:hypothetical protein
MPSSDTIETLNRVLAILERSFPQYLQWARPYIPPGREDVVEAVADMVAGQRALADRVIEMIADSGALPDTGKFPIEFTDTHDLGIDFLIRQAIQCQRQDLANLEQCVEQLRLSPAAQSLAAEALGMAKGHLESLEELSLAPSGSTKFGATPALANDMPVANENSDKAFRQEERKQIAGD